MTTPSVNGQQTHPLTSLGKGGPPWETIGTQAESSDLSVPAVSTVSGLHRCQKLRNLGNHEARKSGNTNREQPVILEAYK